MSSDYAVMLFFLSVKTLVQIPHFIAVGLGGLLGLLFQSLDFFPTLGQLGFKSLGLTPRETVRKIAKSILAVGIPLGFRFRGLTQSRLFLFFRTLLFLDASSALGNQPWKDSDL